MRIDPVHAQCHILPRGQPRHQRRGLEHHRPVRPGAGNFLIVENNATAGNLVEPRHHGQDRRLAAARMADQRDELAPVHVEGEILQHRQRALRGRVHFLRFEDLHELPVDRRRSRIAIGLGQPPARGINRRHIRCVAAVVSGRLGAGAHLDQIVGHLRPQRDEVRVLVDCRAVARTRQIDLEGRAQCRLGAGVERNDPVRQQDRLIHVIGDEDHRLLVFFPDGFDLVLQLGTGQGVECRQGLIEQQHVRVHRQGARHRHALPHAAGQFRRQPVRCMGQAHKLHIFLRAGGARVLALLAEHRIDSETDILRHCQPRHQRIGLEHKPPVRTGPVNGLALHGHRSFIRHDKACDGGDQRGLAASGKPDNRNKLSLFHLKVDAGEDLRMLIAVAIGF